VVSQKRVAFSDGLDEDQFGVLSGENREMPLVNRRDSVAHGEAVAVHFHAPSRRGGKAAVPTTAAKK
jgi:hypothetical protein